MNLKSNFLILTLSCSMLFSSSNYALPKISPVNIASMASLLAGHLLLIKGGSELGKATSPRGNVQLDSEEIKTLMTYLLSGISLTCLSFHLKNNCDPFSIYKLPGLKSIGSLLGVIILTSMGNVNKEIKRIDNVKDAYGYNNYRDRSVFEKLCWMIPGTGATALGYYLK